MRQIVSGRVALHLGIGALALSLAAVVVQPAFGHALPRVAGKHSINVAYPRIEEQLPNDAVLTGRGYEDLSSDMKEA
jgi:hypothetical protein